MTDAPTPESKSTKGIGALGATLCGFAHGILCFLSQPMLSWWSLSFAAVLPMVFVITRSRQSPKSAALFAAIGTLPYWLYTQRWVIEITGAGFVPMCFLQAFWTWLFVWIAIRWLRASAQSRRSARLGPAIIIPIVFVGVEFLRSEVAFTGYSWGVLAYPLIDDARLASPAALLGVYFVSFLVCVPAGAFGEWLSGERGSHVRALAMIALAVITWIVSASIRPAVSDTQAINVGVVQTNLPQNNKLSWSIERSIDDLRRFIDLTAEVSKQDPRPDVIVWPETMVPGGAFSPDAVAVLRREQIVRYFDRDGKEDALPATWFADQLVEAQRLIGVRMLVGAEGTDGFRVDAKQGGGVRFNWDKRFNSVFMLDKGNVLPMRYDKGRLTPFGEFFPYIEHWPWLQKQMLAIAAQGMSFNLNRGTSRAVFEVPAVGSSSTVRVVTPICFEVTHAGFMRGLVAENGKRRADVIISPTNDGWFNISNEGREHHLMMARWRCVELNTPMARSANTGVSAFIDAAGRVTARGIEGNAQGHEVEGFLAGTLRFGDDAAVTLFARVGNVFGWGCLVMTLAAALVGGLASMWRGRPRRAEGTG
jgi:apolipoprotein N-acyltransferase